MDVLSCSEENDGRNGILMTPYDHRPPYEQFFSSRIDLDLLDRLPLPTPWVLSATGRPRAYSSHHRPGFLNLRKGARQRTSRIRFVMRPSPGSIWGTKTFPASWQRGCTMRAMWSLRLQLRGQLAGVELVAIRARRRSSGDYWEGYTSCRDLIESGRGASKGSYFSFYSSIQSEG